MDIILKNKKLVTAVLTLLATLLLLCGWITVKGEMRSYMKETMRETVDEVDEIIDEFDDWAWILGDDVKKGDLRSMRNMLKTLNDAAISPSELGALAVGMGTVNKLGGLLGMGSILPSGSAGGLWVAVIVFWVTLLCGLVTAYLRYAGKAGKAALVFTGLMLVMFIATLVINGQLSDGYIEFGLTAWPFLAIIFTGCALALERMPESKLAAVGDAVATAVPAAAAAGGWTCPGCGKTHPNSVAFCTGCGAKRPETITCPSCGAVLPAGTAFCTSCGAKQGAAPAETTETVEATETTETAE